MNLLLFRHLWGLDGSWETLFPTIQARGYHGIETGVPEESALTRFQQLLSANQLRYIAMVFTSGDTVDAHLESLQKQVRQAQELAPRLINAHSGSDRWSEAESIQYFTEALKIEASAGIPLVHETHRGRILYNPWITDRMLAIFPTLKLCADYSHWVCVCERLIDSELPILQHCAAHTWHLHARVGYEEGPQVPDPRAPEYQRALEAHERWWSLIWDAQQARGDLESTLTPEYGPPGYLHTLPYTNMPVANLAEICDWQAQREASLFATRFGL